MESFSRWIKTELEKRDWKPADLARNARIKDATLSRILSGSRNAGPSACNGIAQAFGLSPEVVFRRAGLLPLLPPEVEEEQEVIAALRKMSPGDRQAAVKMFRALAGATTRPPDDVERRVQSPLGQSPGIEPEAVRQAPTSPAEKPTGGRPAQEIEQMFEDEGPKEKAWQDEVWRLLTDVPIDVAEARARFIISAAMQAARDKKEE